jgi:hypothetical protein
MPRDPRPSLADALYPNLSATARAKEAAEAKWRAEQKAQQKRMVEQLRAINERLAQERGR